MFGTCFFIGHRDTPESIKPALLKTVERHIVEEGVSNFIVGRYGSFDRLAARAVIEAKERHPGISLTLLLPYHPAERPVSLPEGFDGSFYPAGMEHVPRRLAIVRANRYAVDAAQYLIVYVSHPASNACELLEYAKKREQRGLIQTENVWDQMMRH